MEAPLDIPCPGCGRALPPEAVLCPSCGYDQKTGGRAQRTYEPLQRTWVAGWPFARRFQLFLLTQAIGVSLAYLGALLAGSIVAFLAPWLIYTAVTAFLLGTYDRVDLTRNERGKVILRHTWRVFFVARPTERIRLAGYEGVATGRRPSGDFWDWLICIILFFAGIVPGVLWWYFIILHDTFYVALTKDHGHADRTLYRDWNDSAAKELATTLRNVGFAGLGD
jgi:hypothetical protein